MGPFSIRAGGLTCVHVVACVSGSNRLLLETLIWIGRFSFSVGFGLFGAGVGVLDSPRYLEKVESGELRSKMSEPSSSMEEQTSSVYVWVWLLDVEAMLLVRCDFLIFMGSFPSLVLDSANSYFICCIDWPIFVRPARFIFLSITPLLCFTILFILSVLRKTIGVFIRLSLSERVRVVRLPESEYDFDCFG